MRGLEELDYLDEIKEENDDKEGEVKGVLDKIFNLLSELTIKLDEGEVEEKTDNTEKEETEEKIEIKEENTDG